MNLAILQARCSSVRLPGKVLKPLLGVPMILRQIERIQQSAALDALVVATSTDPSDDALAEILHESGIQVRRGSLTNVLSRFMAIAEEFRPQNVVRLTADNPLADPKVIDLVVASHVASGADYSSNSLVRTFPYGLDVECVRRDALLELAEYELSPEECEHVTLGIYSRPDTFSLHPVTQGVDNSELRWTVDYPADFEFVEAIFRELHGDNPVFGLEDVLSLLERRPELRRTATDVPDD